VFYVAGLGIYLTSVKLLFMVTTGLVRVKKLDKMSLSRDVIRVRYVY
jgi:hypothetical protein